MLWWLFQRLHIFHNHHFNRAKNTCVSAKILEKIGKEGNVGYVGHDRMVVGFTTTYAMSVLLVTTKIASLNPAHREVFWLLDMTLYNKVLSVACSRSVVFSGYSGFSLPLKLTATILTEILLKVALSIKSPLCRTRISLLTVLVLKRQ